MTTHHFISASIANRKVVTVAPGPNSGPFKIGLYPYMLSFDTWVAATVATTWNNSGEASLTAIKAVAADDGSVSFTHQTVGEDFEITLMDGNGGVGSVSSKWHLSFSPTPGGGYIILSDGTNLSGHIAWNATPATFTANIQAAINAMTGYTAGDVVVSYLSGIWTLDFSGGKFAGQEVTGWTIDSTNLTGGNAAATITTVQNGNAGQNEQVTVHFPAFGTHTESLNEIQRITMGGSVTSGNFILSMSGHGSSEAIPFTAGRSRLKKAFENWLGLGTVKVTGGPLTEVTGLTGSTDGTWGTTTAGHTTAGVWSGGSNNGSYGTVGPVIGFYQGGAVAIPANSTIAKFAAQIGTTFSGSGSPPITSRVYGVLPGTPYPTDNTSATAALAALTTAYVTLVQSDSLPVDLDLSTIAQEIVNHAGWSSGANMIFVIKPVATGSLSAVNNYLLGNGWTYSGSPTYAYHTADIEFIGSLAGTNLAQMTADSLVTVSTIQDGGSQTVDNITGGTWALVLANNFTVDNIPYNVSAGTLQSMIVALGGAGAATVTGGAAPGTDLVITFGGALANEPLTVSVISSLTGNFGSSVTVSAVRPAITLPTLDNVWDLTVLPGEDTLAVAPATTSTGYLVIRFVEPAPTNPVPTINAVVNVPLLGINAQRIEDAINEAFAQDMVRVTRVVHSQEKDILDGHASYTGDQANPLHFWYYKDVFRLVFCKEYQAAASITDIQVSMINTDPSTWMTQPDTSSDAPDYFPEALRTYLGFYTTWSNGNPLQLFSAARVTDVLPNQLSYKVKLQNKYPLGVESPSTETRVGVARQLLDSLLTINWCKRAYTSHTETPTDTVLLASTTVNWDASADQIQSALETMVSGFLGVGNVRVEGTLWNSWLSEGTIDDPDTTEAYNDLRITLLADLLGQPLNEVGYLFQCVLTNSPVNNTDQLRAFEIRTEEYSKPNPGALCQRNRIVLASPGSVTNLSISIDNGTPIPFTPETTCSALQTLIATALGCFPTISAYDPLPDTYRLPVTVYGTTCAKPIELEFTGFGYQNLAHTLAFGVSVQTDIITVTVNTLGVIPISEVQSLTITGTPTGGTYTVNGSGNIAYNAVVATIQTAVGGPPPTISGTYPNFLITWPSASGNVGQWATTSALNNSINAGVLTESQHGGSQANFVFTESLKGAGPKYADVPANYDTNLMPQCGDTVIIDDNIKPFAFGVNWTALFAVTNLSASQFTYVRRRVVFPNNLKVQLFVLDGAAPTGMTHLNYYRVVNGDTHGQFTLVDADTLAPITITDKGTGHYELRVTGIAFIQYSRGTPQLGLPNRRSSGGSIEHLSKFFRAGFASIEVGVEAGDGLSLARIDTIDISVSPVIHKTSAPDSAVVAALEFLFNNVGSVLTMENGNVGIAVYSGETSTLDSFTMQAGATLTVGNVTLAGDYTNNGGTLTILKGNVSGNIVQR